MSTYNNNKQEGSCEHMTLNYNKHSLTRTTTKRNLKGKMQMIDVRIGKRINNLKSRERYGFHEGFEKVEKPGSTELIVEMVLKLLAKEETFKKLLKGVMEDVVLNI